MKNGFMDRKKVGNLLGILYIVDAALWTAHATTSMILVTSCIIVILIANVLLKNKTKNWNGSEKRRPKWDLELSGMMIFIFAIIISAIR